MLNLDEVGPALLAHLRDDASVQPALVPRVEAFAALLRSRLGAQALHAGWPRPLAPVLTARFDMPQDITLASLRVEHMFAADAATRAVLQAQVSSA
jgi:hypothetical protein